MCHYINKRFSEWVLAFSVPDKEIIALNFGLFEGENTYFIYVTGSVEYDENTDDWATKVDYEPSVKYFVLEEKDTKALNWTSILHLVEKLITNFMKGVDYGNSILSTIEHITVGFDDGDLKRIQKQKV